LKSLSVLGISNLDVDYITFVLGCIQANNLRTAQIEVTCTLSDGPGEFSFYDDW
jgi:hypothetical protein